MLRWIAFVGCWFMMSFHSVSWSADPTPAEQKILKLIEARGGKVMISDEENEPTWRVEFETPKDTDFATLRDAVKIRTVSVYDASNLTDRSLVVLKSLPNLEKIDLNKCRFGLSTMSNFTACKNLKYLYLSQARMSDGIGAGLKACANLKILYLNDTQVADKTMAAIQSISSLEEINVSGTYVTDNGILQLKDMPNLKTLYVQSARVKTPAIQKLEEAIKGITIHR